MIELKQVVKMYRHRLKPVVALDGVNLTLRAGEWLFIHGPSGSGKSTLLLTIGAMLQPSQGAVYFNGQALYQKSEKELRTFRSLYIGFVFQMFNLLPYLNVLDNVLIGKVQRQTEDLRAARHLLEQLGLSDRLQHRPAELSVGECQRVAMARALLKRPGLLLADEPTGNLDEENANQILAALRQHRQNGGSVVMVSHGPVEKSGADRVVYLCHGKLSDTQIE